MESKKKPREDLNTINETIFNTEFILNNGKPKIGIYKVLLYWFISFSLATLFFYLVFLLNDEFKIINLELYFMINRYGTLFLYSIPLIVYIVLLKKTNMTLKERNFLKVNFIFFVMFSFEKILYPLSFYINLEVLIMLYEIFPISIVFLLILLINLHNYFKNKKYWILESITFIYMLALLIVKLMVYQQITNLSEIISYINNVLNTFNYYSILLIFVFLLSLILIKNEKNESRYIQYI